MAKILLIEDDRPLVKIICDSLESQQHTVEFSFSGREGLEMLRFYKFELVILDWKLPEVTGVEICRQFRAKGGDTPILMLTGKQALEDKEAGLDAGADDYLTKPFAMRELSARVRALLRRPTTVNEVLLRCRDIELESITRSVTKSGREIKLVAREFALLEFLLRHQGQTFTYEALLDRVWPSASDATDEAIKSCIKRLRSKLDDEGVESVIKSVYGVGYKLEP